METAAQMDSVLVRRVGSRMEDLLTGQLRVKRKLAELERTIGKAKSEIPDIAASTLVSVSLTVEEWAQFTRELREAVRPKFFKAEKLFVNLGQHHGSLRDSRYFLPSRRGVRVAIQQHNWRTVHQQYAEDSHLLHGGTRSSLRVRIIDAF